MKHIGALSLDFRADSFDHPSGIVDAGTAISWIDKVCYAVAASWSGSFVRARYMGNMQFRHAVPVDTQATVQARVVHTDGSDVHVQTRLMLPEIPDAAGDPTVCTSSIAVYSAEEGGTRLTVPQWVPATPNQVERDEQARRSTVARLQGRGGPAYSRARKYLLVGIARCGVCGTPVNTQYSPTGTRQYGCPQGHVTRGADNVDTLVEKVLLAQLRRSPGLDLSGRDESTDHMAEAEALRARLTDLALEFADGILTAAQLRTATERIQQKLQDVEARLSSAAGNPTLAALAASQDVAAAWEKLDLDRRRAVVDAVLEIEIHRTRRGAGFRPQDVTIKARVSD